jgi:NADPH-dependent 2,4-dienoyl-CoA reductase/sulfur reductase-like enzyme
MKTDILIIGGGPAGVVAAVTARKNYPTKKITLIRAEKQAVIPCGIPYIFHRLTSVKQDLMGDKSLIANKIELLIEKVQKIEPNKKQVVLASGQKMLYQKLILATGSQPATIPIEGVDKKGVWYIKKDVKYLEKLRRAVKKAKNIVIIGGGFIGVEVAEELSHIKNLKISIVERLSHCLAASFDEEFARAAEERLINNKVKIYTGHTVQEIGGDKMVKFVAITENNKSSIKKIKADLVILGLGAKPNASLAQKAGLKIGAYGGIKVNSCMQTSQADIFAIGDCAETKCLLTKRYLPIMLASTACHEARIAAVNLYRENKLIKNKGTLAVFSTFVNGLTLGIAGLTEKTARDLNFEIIIGQAQAPNCHPAKVIKAQNIEVKLIFDKNKKTLLGAQAMGPKSIGEMINMLALAIQENATVYDFDTLQIATHPLLTSAPTIYPPIKAAQMALGQLKK